MDLDIYGTFVSFLENYGWYILLFGIILIYLYQSILKSHINEFLKRRDQQAYAEKYHKNPDLFIARQIAQQEVALKLQEKYRRDAEEYQKKVEQREAKKREEIAARLEGKGGGKRLGDSSTNQESSFKPGYNPLMGGGSGSTYRAPKRSACSRGGCG